MSFQRSQSDLASAKGKDVLFGSLIKISGTGAYQDKKGILHHTLEDALEFAKQYEESPAEYQLGYYQDPEKPDNVWMAEGDAKFLLDRARREKLPLEFADTFKILKKKRVQEKPSLLQVISNFSTSSLSLLRPSPSHRSTANSIGQ